MNAKTVNTVMFSHPAAGPLTALQALELALAHLTVTAVKLIEN